LLWWSKRKIIGKYGGPLLSGGLGK
jgi:hypothetical protein